MAESLVMRFVPRSGVVMLRNQKGEHCGQEHENQRLHEAN
jgi:hypothetical protein